MRTSTPTLLALVFTLSCGGNASKPAGDEPGGDGITDAGDAPTAQQAADFALAVDKDLREKWVAWDLAAWDHQTNLTPENEKKATEAEEMVMAYTTTTINAAARFDGVEGLDPKTARQLTLLKRATSLPAPSDADKRARLAAISTELSGMYGKGKYCTGEGDAATCRDLGELSEVLATNRDWDAQLEAWEGWRTVSPPMRPKYESFVALGNEGAKDIGFSDVGTMWRGGYDMPADDFEKEVDRLWAQVSPLYEQLHCHVRAELAQKYGTDKVAADGLIPAHVTGNMWSQSWENLYPMLEPFEGQPSLDVTAALQEQDYDAVKMVKAGEGFFTSLGLDPLPDTFWERSMLTQPDDREVVCHASAWDPHYNNDLRIKMCIKPTMEDYITIHHELGHNYYYHYYYQQPILFQTGAHDGFHEAVGDAIALSVTPSYLKEVGLLTDASTANEAVINQQMQLALSKIAFLPFGRMIDQWRWDVFSGKVPPEQWNQHWWELRKKYQGIGAPSARGEEYFDPGAKYHIPANTPYMRYFLAAILQFQFHESMCQAAGQDGPLHECSVYGSKEAGKKLEGMLSLGASQPWPDALEKMTGTRQMNAEPLVKYFDPLMGWLEEQNKDRQCGW